MRETITTVSRAVRNNINLTTVTDPSTCERVGEEKSDTAGEGVSEEERRARQIAMILLLYTTNKMTGTIDAHTAATNCLRSLTGTSLDAVVSQLPADTVRDVREASSCLSEAGNPAEAIGSLHRDVMPATYRARRGQYWTPTRVAEVMGGWVIEHSGESVYEPGVGAGSLAAAVARRSHGKSGVGRICGIDTSALAGLMTQTAVAVENAALDFDFEQRPMRDVAASHSLTTDGIVANPPYLSAEMIEDAVKRDWQDHIREVVGRDVSERTPLHAYWLYDIASILQPGGVAAVLLPAEILAANYADELKRHLLAETNIKSLVLFDLGESLFQSATTRSLLLCLQKRVGSARAVPTQLVRVTEWPGSETLLSTLSSRQSGETDWGTIKVVRQADLQATEDWTARLEPSLPSDARCMCPLSEIATVRTGIVTGTNEFYCLSADDVAEWAIDETYLAPLLPSPQKITGCTYDQDDWDAHRSAGEDVYLLYHVKGIDDSAITSPQESERRGDIMTDGAGSLAREDGGVHAYLRHGMRTTVQAHTGIAANREPWYRVRRRQPAPILVPYVTSSSLRAIRNRTSARYLNNLLGVFPDTLDEREQTALVAYLNSELGDQAYQSVARHYGGGMVKAEQSDLERMQVLDPRALSGSDLARLEAAVEARAGESSSSESGAASREGFGRGGCELDAVVRAVIGSRATGAPRSGGDADAD